MSHSTTQDPKTSAKLTDKPAANNEFQYRTISKSTIACVGLTVLGLAAFIGQAFVLLPVLSIGFGIVALMEIKKYPEELAGKVPTQIALLASLLILISSVSLHTYVYLTEVPDGYTRMAFSDLRPNPRTPKPFSEKSETLDGKKVFLKGYTRPSDRKYNLKDFILVGDWGDCCFGGNPKITEVVAINIKSDDRVDYSLATRKIGGVFKLNRSTKRVDEKDIPQVFYTIEADYIR
jgi:hypothetical protein